MTTNTTYMCAVNPWRRSVCGIPPVEESLSLVLIVAGGVIVASGLADDAIAQVSSGASIAYNEERITAAVNAIMTYLEGSFGALIMASAGIGAIMSAAFGQYKASLSLLVVSVGSFILRSLMGTFFNDVGIQQ